MQFFVVWPDGQKFGPADVDKLNEWLAEGRINADTEVESVIDGSRSRVGLVAGVVQPGATAQTSQPAASTAAPITQAASGDRYFVLGPGGQKFGPADASTLTQWAAENRLTATTELEHETTGMRTYPGQVPGLILPLSQTTAQSSPIQPTSVYGANPGSGSTQFSNYPRDAGGEGGKTEAIVSFVCSAIGLLCCPCLFSVAGIILGNQAKKKGSPLGQAAIIVGIVSLVAGFIIGVIVNLTNPALQELMRGGR